MTPLKTLNVGLVGCDRPLAITEVPFRSDGSLGLDDGHSDVKLYGNAGISLDGHPVEANPQLG